MTWITLCIIFVDILRCSDFDEGDEGEIEFVLVFFWFSLFWFVRCLQNLDWGEKGLTSQQVEAKIAALSQLECEQVERWVFLFLFLCFFVLTNECSLWLNSNKLKFVPQNIVRFKNLQQCVVFVVFVFLSSVFLFCSDFICTSINWRVLRTASENWNSFNSEQKMIIIIFFF